MERRSNWTPTIVSNQAGRVDGVLNINEPAGVIRGRPFSAASATNTHAPDDTLKVKDRRADIRFTIGVALALSLPVLIGIGLYVATSALLKAG